MALLTGIIVIAAKAAGIVILVDFFSGVFHWIEDSYGTAETPIIGKLVVIPNLIHHRQPRDFVKSPFWRRNTVTIALSLVIFLGLARIWGVTWELCLFCVLGGLCNEFHCWAHRSPEENGRVITWLHRLRILQTPGHHAVHHTDPKNRAYCVLTNYTNPVLDKMEFWRRTEWVIGLLTGVRPRPDASVAGGMASA